MKTAISLLFVAFAATGCVSMGPMPGSSRSAGSPADTSMSTATATLDAFPPAPATVGPTLILPTTGGPPVMGIPLGGNLFLPVTGGAPVIGIQIGP